MIRFAALGDSITVGLGDQGPDGVPRGWARILADGLGAAPAVELRCLAANGARAGDVVDRQLPAAIAFRPHLASVIVGVNDTLRGRFDLAQVGHAITTTVAQLTAVGALVLTCRLPDPARMLGIPRPLGRPLARRVGALNAVVDAAAARYRTVHFDAGCHPDVHQRRMWSADRLHPSERGHRLVAHAFAALLRERGVRVARLPDLEPDGPQPGRAAQAWWLATQGTRWVLQRSTDLLPDLVGLAATEWWYRRRGLVATLDARTGREVAAVLAALAPPTPGHAADGQVGTRTPGACSARALAPHTAA